MYLGKSGASTVPLSTFSSVHDGFAHRESFTDSRLAPFGVISRPTKVAFPGESQVSMASKDVYTLRGATSPLGRLRLAFLRSYQMVFAIVISVIVAGCYFIWREHARLKASTQRSSIMESLGYGTAEVQLVESLENGDEIVVESTAAAVPDTQAVDVQEIVPDIMAVKDLANRSATLIVRQRKHRKTCMGQLLIWSGKKRAKAAGDSLYALGEVDAQEVTDDIVQEFLVKAVEKMIEVKSSGKQKRETKAVVGAAAVAPVQDAVIDTPVVEAIAAVAAVEPVIDETPAPVKTRRKFPSIHRGTILDIGYGTQSKDGRDFRSFRVKVRDEEGLVEEVFGAHLKTACLEAKVAVGDSCEILKIGKRTAEVEGRAPMNLFQVTKIALQESGETGNLIASSAS